MNPFRINCARPCTPPVCTTTGPATATTFKPCSTVCSTSIAVWRTAVSTWRSEEMPLLMNAYAAHPYDHLIARLKIAHPAASGMSIRDHYQRVHALILHLDPLLLVAYK